MNGRRIESPFASNGGLINAWPEPGDYWFYPEQGWCATTPSGHMANLSAHNVIEHEDRTITVAPSILVSTTGGGHAHDAGIRVTEPGNPRPLWHGYLERGVWREC